MEPAVAFERAFADVRDDVRDYIHAASPAGPSADMMLRLERIQLQLADDLRAGLTDLDVFQREKAIMYTQAAFRQALTTAGLIDDRTSMRMAREAVAKVGVLLQAQTHDERFAAQRKETMDQLVADNVLTWQWKATLDVYTCLFCVSRHGQSFPVGQPMLSHPNCRCLPVKPDRRLGDGERFLARLSGVQRRRLMGKRRAAMYDAGMTTLSDLIDESRKGVIPLRNFRALEP